MAVAAGGAQLLHKGAQQIIFMSFFKLFGEIMRNPLKTSLHSVGLKPISPAAKNMWICHVMKYSLAGIHAQAKPMTRGDPKFEICGAKNLSLSIHPDPTLLLFHSLSCNSPRLTIINFILFQFHTHTALSR